MPFDSLVASAVPALSIELPTIVSIAAVIITILLALLTFMVGLAGWAGRREIARNDEAHRDLKASIDTSRRELRADLKGVEGEVKRLLDMSRRELRADVKGVEGEVKRLLEGQARMEATIAAQSGRRIVRSEDSLREVEPDPTTH